MPAFAGMTNFHFAEQTLVSGFGYLIYAAYLAEVEHKVTSKFYSRNLGNPLNGPKLAGEDSWKRFAVCGC